MYYNKKAVEMFKKETKFNIIDRIITELENEKIDNTINIDLSYKDIIKYELCDRQDVYTDHLPFNKNYDFLFITFDKKETILTIMVLFYDEDKIIEIIQNDKIFFKTLSKLKSKIRKEKINKLCYHI